MTIGYYDNVKDSVRNTDENNDTSTKKKTSTGSSSMNKANFETLRQAASEETEQEGDDTPIEVLEEGLRKRGSSQQSAQQQGQPQNAGGSGAAQQNVQRTASANTDVSGLEDKLDRIIEQNERMIQILESFGE